MVTRPPAVLDEPVAEMVEVGPPPSTLFRTENPEEVVKRATETANALAEVVKSRKLTTTIQRREHVRVEGWTLLGTMLGVFPVCTWTRKLEDGWEARVEARTRDGAVVGAAEAHCLRSESNWSNRDDFALRSMAQTRATSKALRQPLGFVMTLAGFEATPAEEMSSEEPTKEEPQPTQADRDALNTLLGKLGEFDDSKNWAHEADTYAQKTYGKPLTELVQADLRKTTEALQAFYDSQNKGSDFVAPEAKEDVPF
jgi:hypothetical protein